MSLQISRAVGALKWHAVHFFQLFKRFVAVYDQNALRLVVMRRGGEHAGLQYFIKILPANLLFLKLPYGITLCSQLQKIHMCSLLCKRFAISYHICA